jgi:hypothetical protein
LSTYVPTHTSPLEEKEVRDIYRFVEDVGVERL